MKTTKGHSFNISKGVCTLYIPLTQGEFTVGVQASKREIIANHELPYFREIRIKKKANN